MAGTLRPDGGGHEGVEDLLGAYALDAVEPEERELVEAHLAHCDRCRAEVADHREVAAALAGGGSAPEGLWDRLAASLSDAPPPEVVPLDRMRPAARARRREHTGERRWLGVAAAAAVVFVLALGGAAYTITDQNQQIDDIADELAAAQSPEGMRVAQMVDVSGDTTVSAVVAGEQGYLFADGLEPLDPGWTYQLWGASDGRMRSLGLLGDEPSLETFEVREGVTTLAITREESPGATEPTTEPLVAGDLV
jgi:hypothetical protein